MIRDLRLLALAAICAVPLAAPAQNPNVADPVEELRQVLKTPVRDPGNRDELLWRQEQLKARAKALGVGDLRRALLLQEWRYEDREAAIAAVDKPVRDSIVNRLVAALRKALQSKYVPGKLAGITQVGEMGVVIFGSTGHTSLAATLAPELAKLMNDPSSAVRQAAAHAIGRINPDPKLATAALGGLFGSAETADRQAAAEGLLLMLRTTEQVRRSSSPNRLIITTEEAARIDAEVIPLAGRAATDANAAVRQAGIEALQAGAALLTDLVAEVPRLDFPPPGRKPSAEERANIEDYRKEVERERELLLPVARALAAQGAVLRRGTSDSVPQVRLLAERAVEEMGQARIKLLRKAASVPAIDNGREPSKEKTEGRPDEPRPLGSGERRSLTVAARNSPLETKGVVRVAMATAQKLPLPKVLPKVEGVPDPLLPALLLNLPALAERTVSDPVPDVRLAAVDALETLGPEAAPAVPALARALQDCSIFVRWASARVLGKVGPVNTALTVPILAKLLSDRDLDVEQVAANTLGVYGPHAAAAVPALTAAIHAGDPERRIAMLHTLVAIGPAAQPAIPDIASALGPPGGESYWRGGDARVRTAAAEALGHFGAAARSAIPALEKALNDPAGDVRKAASDALLTIAVSGE